MNDLIPSCFFFNKHGLISSLFAARKPTLSTFEQIRSVSEVQNMIKDVHDQKKKKPADVASKQGFCILTPKNGDIFSRAGRSPKTNACNFSSFLFSTIIFFVFETTCIQSRNFVDNWSPFPCYFLVPDPICDPRCLCLTE